MRSLRNEGVLVLVHSRKYDDALHAVIESSLVTWIGILIYEITSFAPMGHITVCTMRFELQEILNQHGQTDLDVGYVMIQIIPIFFASKFLLIVSRVNVHSSSLRAYHSVLSRLV